MHTFTTAFETASPANSVAAEGPDAAFVTIPDAQLLFHGDFKRTGSDLTLTGEDGQRVVVPDYFKHEHPPTLLWCYRRGRRIVRRGLRGLRGRANFGTDGSDGNTHPFEPVAKVGRHAHAHILAKGLQLQRQRHQRLDVAARSDRR